VHRSNVRGIRTLSFGFHMAAWLLHDRRSRSKVLFSVLCLMTVAAYFANKPEAPAPAAPPDVFVTDPTIEFVTLPAPTRPIPGDRGDIRVARGPVQVRMSRQDQTSPFRFEEITTLTGVDFVHVSGMTPEKHFPAANGSGAALFDYDGDGRLDLYLVSSTFLPVGKSDAGRNRLYKNLDGTHFHDVTESSGLGFHGFGHGVVVGDIDNDGDRDVFLCNYGPNRLYRNNGDGTFADISSKAGIDRPSWSSGGAFLDYDNDGDLDLYVANYGRWSVADDYYCGDRGRGARIFCSPAELPTTPHFFYRNNGDGTFTDVYDRAIRPADPSAPGAKARTDGRGFGVVAADLNGDGKVDLFVANDMSPNFVFLNRGDGTFDDATEISGAGYDIKGGLQSGMGADAEDIDGDGRPELTISNFDNMYNTLYRNLGEGRFVDSTTSLGLAFDTLPWVGWGIGLVDLDNDGWPDEFVANGHVDDNTRLTGRPIDEEEPPLLFANLAGKRFRLATRDAGAYFQSRHVGRGAAFGDIDNDGDIDIVVNHRGGPPAILRNDTQNANHWIRFELTGTRSNRDAIGTRVEVEVSGRTIYRQCKGGVSIQSANDPRLLIGIGEAKEVDRLTIRWPSGAITTREHLKAGQSYRIIEPR
jgi:enediyne biosynthesis protein E4